MGISGAIIGGAVIGGGIQADASKGAARAGERASEAGVAEQRAAREDFNARTEPFRQIGVGAGEQLQNLLGFGLNPRREKLQAALDNIPADADPFLAGVARTKLQRELDVTPTTIQTNQLADGSFAPSQDFAPSTVEDFGLGEFEPFDPSTEQRLAEINPVADFLQTEGFRKIREAGPGRNVDRDLSEFQTGLTSTLVPQFDALNLGKRQQQAGERQQQFNEQFNLQGLNLSKRQQRFGELFNVLGIGSNAAAGQGTASLQTAGNIGNLLGAGAAATGAGAINKSNAITGGISNLASAAGAFGRPQNPNVGFQPTINPAPLTQQGNQLGLPINNQLPSGQVFS